MYELRNVTKTYSNGRYIVPSRWLCQRRARDGRIGDVTDDGITDLVIKTVTEKLRYGAERR